MEFIVFILIMVFVLITNGKKTPKKPTAAPPPPAARRPRRDARQFRQRLEELRAQAEAAMREEPAAGIPSEVSLAEGEGSFDEEGCVGGSMAHAHTEGEDYEEHRRHVEALHQRETEESRAALAAEELHALNLQKLRGAVVMAEVLDKPVALRRGRRRRVV